MTRSQRELQQLLKHRNDEAAAQGRPYIRNPATLQQIAQVTDPQAAAQILEADDDGIPAFIDFQPGDQDNPIELLIWAAYMGTRVFKRADLEDDGDPWHIIRQALAELIEQGSPFIKIAQSKATTFVLDKFNAAKGKEPEGIGALLSRMGKT